MPARNPSRPLTIRLASQGVGSELSPKPQNNAVLRKILREFLYTSPEREFLSKAILDKQEHLANKSEYGVTGILTSRHLLPSTLSMFPADHPPRTPDVLRTVGTGPDLVGALDRFNNTQKVVAKLLSRQINEGKDAARAKGRPGRKEKWDWDGAAAHLFKIAKTPVGLPTNQAEVERILKDWFMKTTGDYPAESTIREKIKRWGF